MIQFLRLRLARSKVRGVGLRMMMVPPTDDDDDDDDGATHRDRMQNWPAPLPLLKIPRLFVCRTIVLNTAS